MLQSDTGNVETQAEDLGHTSVTVPERGGADPDSKRGQ